MNTLTALFFVEKQRLSPFMVQREKIIKFARIHFREENYLNGKILLTELLPLWI